MAKSGLPKMYAKMGFKKGWAAFKRARGGGKKRATASKPKSKPSAPARRKKTRRAASVPAVYHSKGGSSMSRLVKISKGRLQEFKDKLKRASAKVRASKDLDLMEVGTAAGEAIMGGVASSYLIGLIPVPASMPKPGLIKSGLQTALGIGGAVAFKNKHIRYACLGAAVIGGVGVMREFLPIPTFAGEVDESMYGESGPDSDYAFMGMGMGEPLGEPLGADAPFNPYG